MFLSFSSKLWKIRLAKVALALFFDFQSIFFYDDRKCFWSLYQSKWWANSSVSIPIISLKDVEFVDHIQLLYEVWSGVGEVLAAKAAQCEIYSEALYNATTREQLSQLDRRISILSNFDFLHDINSTHCALHLTRHAKFIGGI